MGDNASAPVRREWLYEAARASQEMLCEIRGHALDAPHVVKSLRRLPEAATPMERLIRQGLVLDVLLGCVEHSGHSDADRTSNIVQRVLAAASRPAPLLDSPIRRAAIFIRRNCTARFNATHVSRAVGCERSRLRHLFKQDTGMTMQAFHTRARVAKALPLFAAESTKMTTIARSVGYRSDKDLYRALRDVTGQLPAALKLMSRESLDRMAVGILCGFDA
jgi:AraC-like DNA-binding protein